MNDDVRDALNVLRAELKAEYGAEVYRLRQDLTVLHTLLRDYISATTNICQYLMDENSARKGIKPAGLLMQ